MRAWAKVGMIAAVLAAVPQVASAGKWKALLGAKKVTTVKPEHGFVDDPMAFDEAGGRLVYVASSMAGRSELRVIDLAQKGAQLSSIDITSFTTAPREVQFVLDGEQFFVVAADADKKSGDRQGNRQGDRKIGALVGAKGIIRKFGPAKDLRLTTFQGKQAVVSYAQEWKHGKKGPQVFHTVEIHDLASGKRLAKPRTLIADETGKVAKLDFTITYWTDSYTRVVGTKGGSWDRKEDQRTPDQEAWYEVATGTFTRTFPIKDVIGHRKLEKLLAAHDNEPIFVGVAHDLSGVLYYDHGTPRPIGLTETFSHYDPKSLMMQPVSPDGTVFFTLTIDPVNPDAVARRRAVARYLDLYELAPGAKKARRRARILLHDKRGLEWRATPETWVVVPKHIGFDRGGKAIDIYSLTSK